MCNAAESLLVHARSRRRSSACLARRSTASSWSATTTTRAILGADRVGVATDDDYATEFLDLKLAVRVVDSLDEAIDHITRYGTGHSEAIVTATLDAADRFTREVDAAAVLVNASTRFVDGEEFGFGAEIGISTQKLHARGPMGLRELTTLKYVIEGDGHVRGLNSGPGVTRHARVGAASRRGGHVVLQQHPAEEDDDGAGDHDAE